jgi:hypothetical protein
LGVPDYMIEHTFERVLFGICKLFNLYVFLFKQNIKTINNFNKYIFLEKYDTLPILDYKKSNITIITCDTDNLLKINTLINNLKYFIEVSNEIIIINNSKFKNVIENKLLTNDIYIINKQLNNKQTHMYINQNPDISNLSIKEAKTHYLVNEHKEHRMIDGLSKLNFIYDDSLNHNYQKKWYNYINNGEMIKGKSRFILANNSFVIIKSLNKLASLSNTSNKEMISLFDSSYNQSYNYPDYLRIYTKTGINKLIDFYKINFKLTNNSKKIEINSTNITNSKKCLFLIKDNHIKNKDKHILDNHIDDICFPIILLSKIKYICYDNTNIPIDFNPEIYKQLNKDLINLDNITVTKHFIKYGIPESRQYKKNQLFKTNKYIFDKLPINIKLSL